MKGLTALERYILENLTSPHSATGEGHEASASETAIVQGLADRGLLVWHDCPNPACPWSHVWLTELGREVLGLDGAAKK